MSKSWLFKLVAVVAIVVTLAPAFSVQAADPFDWQQQKGATVTLILVKHPYSNAMIPFFPEFEKLTGITVKYDVLSEEQYREKLLVDLSTKKGTYDVFMTGPVDNWKYVPGGLIEPLDKYIEDPKLTDPAWDFKDFWPSLIAASRWSGKPGVGIGEGSLWALPVNEEGYALFYRKDLFDAQKIPVPKTYQELYDTAKKLNGTTWDGKTISGFVARGNKSWPTIHTGYGSVFWSSGGEELDANLNCVISSTVGIQVTDLWANIMKETAPKDVINFTWYEAMEYFAGGKAAMFIDADHMAETFERAETSQVVGKVGYAVPPNGLNGEAPKTQVWAWSIGMNAASKNKPAAWLFMQWASSKDILTKTAVKGNINPCRISVANSPEVAEYMKNWGDYQKTYTYLLDKVVGLRWAPMQQVSQIGDLWSIALQEVILGNKSSADALNAAAEAANKIIVKAGYKQ